MKKEKSLKKNFIMNIILTSSAYIFPLITFPYISRILGAVGNGKINFANSIVSYFIMIAMLGIPVYGIRACAKVKNDKEKLSATVYELITINIITSIVSYVLLFAMINVIPKFEEYKILIIILSTSIALNCIGIEWLFKAFEEYSYITIRSLIFKLISIVLMFLLVKSKQDIALYAFIMVISSSLSYVFNFFRLPKYVLPLKKVKAQLNFKRHIKPVLSFFLLSVSWTIYTHLDVVMLGFVSNDQEVGYYSAAVKIKSILVSGVSALGTVLLPRLTVYVSGKNKNQFYKLLKKDFSFIVIAAVFFIGFLFVNAKEVLIFLSGNEYIAATVPMQIILFTIIFIGLSTMTGTNILVPTGRENITIKATVFGIIINFILNLILIPKYGSTGAAIATLIGESFIYFYEAYYLRKELKNVYNFKTLRNVLISSLCTIMVMIGLKQFIIQFDVFILIFVLGIIYSLIYILFLLILKEEIVIYMCNNFIKKLKGYIK